MEKMMQFQLVREKSNSTAVLNMLENNHRFDFPRLILGHPERK